MIDLGDRALTQAPLEVLEGMLQRSLAGDSSTALAQACPHPWAPPGHPHVPAPGRARWARGGRAQPAARTSRGSAWGRGQARQREREGGALGARSCRRAGWLHPGLWGVLGVQALPGWLHSGPLAPEVGAHWLLPGSQLGCSEWQVVPDPK